MATFYWKRASKMKRKRKIETKKVVRRRRRVVATAPKKRGEVDTIKQKKLIRLISENFGKKGSTKTMYEMMLEAGYSETTAKQQSRILSTIKEKPEMRGIVADLEFVHSNAITALKRKDFNKVDAGTIVRILKDLNHDIELLSGRATERDDGETSLSHEDRLLLDEILEANKR